MGPPPGPCSAYGYILNTYFVGHGPAPNPCSDPDPPDARQRDHTPHRNNNIDTRRKQKFFKQAEE